MQSELCEWKSPLQRDNFTKIAEVCEAVKMTPRI